LSRNCRFAVFALIEFLLSLAAGLAQHCPDGARVEGTVLDPTGAAIAGAEVHANGGTRVSTNNSGHYVLPCLAGGAVKLAADAAGFQQAVVSVQVRARSTAHLDFHLLIARVQTNVEVGGNDATSLAADQGIGTHTLSGKDIQQLADDPDDFKRELQVLAAV